MTVYEVLVLVLKAILFVLYFFHIIRGLYHKDHEPRVESLITSVIFLLLFLFVQGPNN